MSKSRVSREQLVDILGRYIGGETLKSLAKEVEVSSTLIGHRRDKLGRMCRYRIKFMVVLALRCNVSLQQILDAFEEGIKTYQDAEHKDILNELRRLEL